MILLQQIVHAFFNQAHHYMRIANARGRYRPLSQDLAIHAGESKTQVAASDIDAYDVACSGALFSPAYSHLHWKVPVQHRLNTPTGATTACRALMLSNSRPFVSGMTKRTKISVRMQNAPKIDKGERIARRFDERKESERDQKI